MEKMKCVRLVDKRKFSIEEVERPVPKNDEVLVKVAKVGVCGSDINAYQDKHPYIHCPIVLGHEFSGIIAETGNDVKRHRIGSRVTVIPHVVCNHCDACKSELYNFCEELKVIGAQTDGAHAEYVAVPARMVLPIPDELSLEDAALIEPACVSWHGIRRGLINGDKVLIIGAGPIGAFALQAAKVLGAGKVISAEIDNKRLQMAGAWGADGLINLKQESLTDGLNRLVGGHKQIDYFVDCVGGDGFVFNEIIKLARRGSRIVSIGVLGNEYNIPYLPDFVEHELTLYGTTMYVPKDYIDVIELINQGKIMTKGMVTHYYTLEQIPEMFDMIVSKKESFFKIIINVVDDI